MAQANIDGQLYSWASISVVYLGQKIRQIKGISFKTNRSIKAVYGVGDEPIGHIKGSKSYEASITLYSEAVEEMTNIAPERDITKLEGTDIIVTFAKSSTSPRKTIILRNAIPMSREFKADSGGDDPLEVELPLFVTHIDY